MQPLIEETCQLMAPLAAERSITISPALPVPRPGGPWPTGSGCRQILVNLLSNAIKYNREGGARHDHLPGRTARPGQSGRWPTPDRAYRPADLERIFIPFERLGAEQTAIEGTGIGLPLARAFAEAMGGQLTASSVDGEGSTFTITLPARRTWSRSRTSRTAAGLAAPLTAPADPSGGITRMLYIEDNPANIEVVSRFVKAKAEPAPAVGHVRPGRPRDA